MKNPLYKVQDFGQSIWLDYIRRGMLESGELKQMIDEDGLRGVTVNPSILQKAIAGSHDYDEAIRLLTLEDYKSPEIYERLAVEDVRMAADLFLPLHEKSNGKHGFVSLEVSPHLAHDTEGTIEEADRFWHELDRPNVMIKVPATVEGLPAIKKLIEDGINVNVTLLFGLPRYRQVVEAYLSGLKSRMAAGKPLHSVSSVASFFLSRIDVLLDPILEGKIKNGGSYALISARLHGQIAVSSAKMAYQIYQEIYSGATYKELADEGAHPQRLLWASTSTKDPEYSDIKYVETLIGADTVNTLPLETLNAYRDHGNPQARLEEDLEDASRALTQLLELGIDLDQRMQQLVDEGVEKFNKSYDLLLELLDKKRYSILGESIDRQIFYLGDIQSSFTKRLEDQQATRFVDRLWKKDASLWKEDLDSQRSIRSALGWLHVAEKMEENLAVINDFVEEVKSAGFQHIVHLGMGGSSLAPMVMADILKPIQGGLPFHVLDTTHPDAILEMEQSLPLQRTLFIVASKSGTTAETRALADHFYLQLKPALGKKTGLNFIAITDPGTPLVEAAKDQGYRRTFLNYPDIGGRYSALSYFGILPAALMGIDVPLLLDRALRTCHACTSYVPVHENPGIMLGAALGEMALQGRDKVTILAPGKLNKFGMWLEQLLAESTGKEGKGLLPVIDEPINSARLYGNDRLFVYTHLKNDIADLDGRIDALRENSQPVIEILLDDLYDLGEEIFRWEIAVATAGAILRINAFDQLNVQESKDMTKQLLQKVEHGQRIEEEFNPIEDASFDIYTHTPAQSPDEALSEFFKSYKPGDYIALMAYLDESSQIDQALQQLRLSLRSITHLATTSGYGPRFLHSTGQYHKGGPNKGLFVQLTADVAHDLPVPGKSYSFGNFLEAQARGDLMVLRKHGRRAVRIHLRDDADRGLKELRLAIERAVPATTA